MSTLEKTRRFLARRFAISEAEITPERSFESLGIDSLAALELLFDIEDEFGIRLPHDEGKIITMADLVAAIERALEQKCTQAA